MKIRFAVLFLSFVVSLNIKSQSLFINEFMSSNNTALLDKYGNSEDWLEIYNASDAPVQLQGYYLSDDDKNLMKWKFPSAEISAKGFIIVFCSGKNIAEQGNMHTGFKLSNGTEPLILTAPDGFTVIDRIAPVQLLEDISFGRQPDGGSTLYFFEKSTPGASNATTAFKKISQQPLISLNPGFYSGSQKATISASDPKAKIIYTIDGTFPYNDSVSSSIKIDGGEISIDSSTVLRARVKEDSAVPGPVVSNTYLINVTTKLPVVSLATDPANFFSDEKGIYVDKNIDKRRDWERPVNVQFFEGNKSLAFNTSANVRLHGRTAVYYPEKSLALFFTGNNNEIKYKFFEDKPIDVFQSILLRNSSDDWYRTMFRDGFQHTLINGHANVDLMAYRPSIVFINGRYWGIHNIREKVNENYIAENHNVNPDSIDLIYMHFYDSTRVVTDLLSGDSVQFYQLFDFIKKHDMRIKSNYDYVSSRIDMDNYLDLFVMEVFVSNASWDHNQKAWKTRDKDAKWRFVMYDLDKGFGPYNTTIYDSTLLDIYNRNIMFKRLVMNTDFRNSFIQKMNAHLSSTFDITRTIALIDKLQANIADEMPNHIARWKGKCWEDKCGISSMDFWNGAVEKMRKFARLRPDEMRKQMCRFFKLSCKTYYLNLAIATPGTGKITVNNVDVFLTGSTYKALYNADIPLNIKAIPAEGYHFVKWNELAGVGAGFTLGINKDYTLTAVFEKDTKLNDIYINEFCASNGKTIADEYNEYDDWIELYNNGTQSFDIGGLYLTDNLKYPCKWKIPSADHAKTTIPAKGFLLLWADSQTAQGILHLGFSLKKTGNDIGLAQVMGKDTAFIDSLTFKEQAQDVTFGMYPDGTRNYEYFHTPTPGKPNKQDNIPQKITGLYINEFLASNKKIVKDEFGQYDDCIEIYNSNPFPVNIAGLYVTDTLPDPLKYMIPDTKPAATTIPAKGFIVLWTDGTPVQGPQHLGFKLSASGEAIGIAQIYRDEVNKIDGLTFTAQSTDISYGRCPDGGSSFINYMKPTIGFSNVCNPYVEQITNDGSKSSIKAEPNPFREAENINVNIYEPSDCSIIIYNSEGKKIKTIVKQYLNKGNYSFRWNGCNDSGAAVPEGLYLLMLSSGNNARSVKIIKTK